MTELSLSTRGYKNLSRRLSGRIPFRLSVSLDTPRSSTDLLYGRRSPRCAPAKPEGFLCAVESQGPSPRFTQSPLERVQKDYDSLCSFFPDFPAKMIRALLIREQGDASAVYKFLLQRGWTVSSERSPRSAVHLLSREKSPHITTAYYWGPYQSSYLRILSKASPDAFFTAHNPQQPEQYILCFKLDNGAIVKQPIGSPFVTDAHKKLFQLGTELHRPKGLAADQLLGLPL
jgi:hypothetical protein